MNEPKHNFDRQSFKHIIIVFSVNLFALSLFIIFSHVHLTEDAYVYQINNDWTAVEWYVVSFRYFGALVTCLISLTGHNPIVNLSLDIVLYNFISAFVITLLAINILQLLKRTNKLFYIFIRLYYLLFLGEQQWIIQ